MLAVVLVLRLGPICEAVANAAPVASDMAGCENKQKPTKAPQPPRFAWRSNRYPSRD
jgi:hypothetical protein